MKFNLFLSTLFIATFAILFTSCEKHDDILNGTVKIAMIESPDDRRLVDLSSESEHIKVRFTTHTKIEEAYVNLFVEDKSNFTIEGNEVRIKDDTCLKSFPTDSESIIDYKNTSVGETEFVFEKSINLSQYPLGTWFVLFGMAKGISSVSEGYDSKGIYFCKKN